MEGLGGRSGRRRWDGWRVWVRGLEGGSGRREGLGGRGR